VTVAALRRPAGKLTPILSSLSRNARPPFFDLALYIHSFIHSFTMYAGNCAAYIKRVTIKHTQTDVTRKPSNLHCSLIRC